MTILLVNGKVINQWPGQEFEGRDGINCKVAGIKIFGNFLYFYMWLIQFQNLKPYTFIVCILYLNIGGFKNYTTCNYTFKLKFVNNITN